MKVIAYGDFSHPHRCATANMLFCRRANYPLLSPNPIDAFFDYDFHIFEESDTRAWEELVVPFEDYLRSCPTHPLLKLHDEHMESRV